MADLGAAIRRAAVRQEEGVSHGSVAIMPLVPAARFSLRLPPETAAGMGALCGFRFDLGINRCAVSGTRLAARLGPDEWLLIAGESEDGAIARGVPLALGDAFHSLVDIGHRNAAIRVSGHRAADVLNAGCPLDLSDDAFPAGSATRTLLGKAEIVLLRPSPTGAYRIECWRSFAPYVLGFLLAAAREFDTE